MDIGECGCSRSSGSCVRVITADLEQEPQKDMWPLKKEKGLNRTQMSRHLHAPPGPLGDRKHRAAFLGFSFFFPRFVDYTVRTHPLSPSHTS